ncbi:MAG TPA: hypothetical protein VEZ41_14550 [Allosphingosinicella sp.]|jgi:hypothetical protein|nr:hypothetical protein [Allosphingosinicella sp.]
MSDSDLPAHRRSERRKGRGLPILLVTVGVLGAAQAAAWFYFRKNQPVTDELTRERLRRWSDK